MSEFIYVVLDRLLFVVHAVLAGFVAGGTLWLVWAGLRGPRNDRGTADRQIPEGQTPGSQTPEGQVPAGQVRDGHGRARTDGDPLAAALRDWLPFVLGLAITFGIGPLLFVQLFDGGAFYTANLLLSHRFMLLLPALTIGFYLLYVQKTDWRWVRSRVGRIVVPAAAFACFGFTAWSWSENHLLAQMRAEWPQTYARGPGFHLHGDLPFRLAVFFGLALQAVAMLLPILRRGLVDDRRDARRVAIAGALGVALTVAGLLLHPPVAGVSLATTTGALLLLAEGTLLLLWGVASARRSGAAGLVVVPTLLLAVERTADLRVQVRAARGGGGHLAEYASSQGFAVFVLCLLGVTAAIALAARRVRRELGRGAPDSPPSPRLQ